jgi:hypothetical protein
VRQRTSCLSKASACDEARACTAAGINDCEKKGSPCGPTHGQLQDGQSYLCVSFDASNLDTVAAVLRGDELTIYATNINGLADQYPNIQKLIKANRRGDWTILPEGILCSHLHSAPVCARNLQCPIPKHSLSCAEVRLCKSAGSYVNKQLILQNHQCRHMHSSNTKDDSALLQHEAL